MNKGATKNVQIYYWQIVNEFLMSTGYLAGAHIESCGS